MITETQVAEVLQLTSVLAVASLFIFKLLPARRVDSFRQGMFAVRDELFDYAADGQIAFDDPAYLALRRQMNGMIRYGHQLTLFRALLGGLLKAVSNRPVDLSWNHEWESALAALKSDEQRKRMNAFHQQGLRLAARHLITGSPVLWCVITAAFLYLLLQGAATGFRQALRGAVQHVLSGPLDQRRIEEDAVCA
jgi:hypothetical protein